jgi:glycosyltransferase involved in cell wall biosynthesis
MNEEASIGQVLDQVKETMQKTRYEYEVLVIDTNSKDRTREIAREKGAIVVEEPRRGYGRAYKTGFERASGDIIATLDADCLSAEDILTLSDRLSRGPDFTTNRMAGWRRGR